MYKKKVYFLMFVFAAALCVPAVYMSTIQLSHGTCQQTAFYSDSFEVSGVIEPYTDVSVELSYPAYIQNVYVQKGSFVNQGQLLFTLDKKKMQQALNESQNSIKNSSEQASANMVQALPEEIYASEAGIISQLNVQSNSVVWQGSSLCTIAKSDNTVMRITVNQEDYNRINVGDKLKVSPLICENRVYDGVIINRCAAVRKENSAFGTKMVIDVFAQISSPDEYIVQGVQFKGQLVKPEVKKMNILPYEFIHQDSRGEYVNVFDGGKSTTVYVKTGKEFEAGVEILTSFNRKTIFLKSEKIKKDKILLINDIQ